MIYDTNSRSLKILLVLFALYTNTISLAQYTVKGFVKERLTNQPVAAANVFLSNTQRGIMSNTDGSFSISVSQGEWDLVVSCIGFETQVKHITSRFADSSIRFYLLPKIKDLGNVTVQSSNNESNWLSYYGIFKDAFLGNSSFVSKCTIENKEVIHFHFDSSNYVLSAYAGKPIVIVNKALGYRLQYQLEDFTLNSHTQELVYDGYPLFTQLSGTSE